MKILGIYRGVPLQPPHLRGGTRFFNVKKSACYEARFFPPLRPLQRYALATVSSRHVLGAEPLKTPVCLQKDLTVGQALLELLFTAPRISTYKIEFNDFS